jgi:hypothetical protein
MFATGVRRLSAPDEVMPVGLDGFFVFQLNAGRVDAEAAVDALSLEVRDGNGELVEGDAAVLREESEGNALELMIGWTSRTTRTPNEVLEVRGSAENSVGRVELAVKLDVRDASAELALPELESEWRNLRRDTGDITSCSNGCVNSCSNNCVSTYFGVETEEVLWVNVGGLTPETPVTVAWEYTLDEVPGKGQLAGPAPFTVLVRRGSAATSLYAGLAFRDTLDEYCVRLTARDLKTDTSLASEFCSSPERPLQEASGDRIFECSSVPPEFMPRWCEYHPSVPACADYVAPSDAGDRRRTSQAGCSIQASDAGRAGLAAGMGLLALTFARRRRLRASRC